MADTLPVILSSMTQELLEGAIVNDVTPSARSALALSSLYAS